MTRDRKSGFTLIELMVVIAILAILAAIIIGAAQKRTAPARAVGSGQFTTGGAPAAETPRGSSAGSWFNGFIAGAVVTFVLTRFARKTKLPALVAVSTRRRRRTARPAAAEEESQPATDASPHEGDPGAG